LTFGSGRLPLTDAEALREARGYLRAARRESGCKLKKWIMWTERKNEFGDKVRLHVHVIVTGPSRMLRRWKPGRVDVQRVETRKRFDEVVDYYCKRIETGEGEVELVGLRRCPRHGRR